jgi:hypothetical protein
MKESIDIMKDSSVGMKESTKMRVMKDSLVGNKSQTKEMKSAKKYRKYSVS